ncbi:hypothetical protein DVK85_00165 [Flavobacterium arcticum]|uniref:Lipocalin-like domain-containing protein n=1 Tax=Flavobacterium arcticum TaxID=1784713 RepID=A0A345H819_9FLAO|nr:lipocalin family protein [Flavobacterium arcticum]AXG72729.1 hypothetical protein DVK85_00165 [Flavobacterium arcticum]KAF2511000.1 hypothetical protein E0W72_06300 [Flavobacterium arcticum]
MKKCILLLLAIITISCGNNIADEDLVYLNGYWEIEVAIMPDGIEKEYKVNPIIDYFELKDNKGIRKKVMPQFDGTYRVNDTSEEMAITKEDNKTYISYTTDFSKWKEQILEIDEEHLVLKNEQDIEYHYKKPQPFSIK